MDRRNFLKQVGTVSAAGLAMADARFHRRPESAPYSQAGAQVIFHAVNSGSSQKYREYHESNLKVRSAEAKCPIVVVNAAHDEPINCASGVVRDFEYVVSLPRKGEVIQTVQFTPRPVRSRLSQENRTR